MTKLTIDLEKAGVKQVISRSSDRMMFTKDAVHENPSIAVSQNKAIEITGYIDDLFKKTFIEVERNNKIEKAKYFSAYIKCSCSKEVLMYKANKYFLYGNELSISIYLDELDYNNFLHALLSKRTKTRLELTFYEKIEDKKNGFWGLVTNYEEVILTEIVDEEGNKGWHIKQNSDENWVNMNLASWIDCSLNCFGEEELNKESIRALNGQQWQISQKDFNALKNTLYLIAFLIFLTLIIN